MEDLNKGLECKPGDRGDASNTTGIGKLKGPGSPAGPKQCKSELSKGYDTVNPGWGGSGVRR